MWPEIPCVSCIGITCDEKKFVPGCSKNNNCGYKDAYSDTGADDCLLTQIARALNIFQFDFYNDWVNGSLYNFLLKYKKRSNKQEKFCEYNCDDLVGGGVDGISGGGGALCAGSDFTFSLFVLIGAYFSFVHSRLRVVFLEQFACFQRVVGQVLIVVCEDGTHLLSCVPSV